VDGAIRKPSEGGAYADAATLPPAEPVELDDDVPDPDEEPAEPPDDDFAESDDPDDELSPDEDEADTASDFWFRLSVR
jgi:hypothetical protein